MALSSADIALIKTYIKGVYSPNQLIKWTNVDAKLTPSMALDEDVFTNMINSAYASYMMFFSRNFSTASEIAMDTLCRGVIMTMQNWRNEKVGKLIQEFYVGTRKAIAKQQRVLPVVIDLKENSKNPDSSTTQYDGISYKGKL